MQIIHSVSEMQAIKINSLGFVPTMGYLHAGHVSLIRRSVKENIKTAVSIFVNPTQFGKNEDFDNYPKNLTQDLNLLKNEKVDYAFIPNQKELYPEIKNLFSLKISNNFNKKLCAKYRPGHFEGVAQIIMKLFNIVRPENAYFGLKDYQQFIAVKALVEEYNLPVKIIGCDLIRETSGLAMSSRNAYLNPSQRKEASSIYQALTKLQNDLLARAANLNNYQEHFVALIAASSPEMEVQYIEIYDRELNKINKIIPGKMLLGCAIWFHNVRLIDNLLF